MHYTIHIMKHTLLTFTLLLTTYVGLNAQARLGSSLDDIKAEFSDPVHNFRIEYNKNGELFAYIDTDRATVLYSFDDEKYCDATAIFPANQGFLNAYVEYYNKQYVIISNTEWKMYSSNGIATIQLHFTDDAYFFVWK